MRGDSSRYEGTGAEGGAPFERRLDARLVLSVVAAGIMSFSGVVVETAMNVTFPALMAEFSVGTSTVQWMTTAYLLILAIIIPTSGYLNRRFRTRPVFLVAMCFYISGIVCGATAQSFGALLLGRCLEGTGTGIALPLMFNIIQEQAPERQMGTMMGIGSLVCALAPAVGPSLGGWISENLGWRWIFLALLPVLLVALVLGLCSIRQSHAVARERFDVRGWLVLDASFVCLVLSSSEAGVLGFASPAVLGLLAAFAVLLLAFARFERSRERPLIDLSILGSRRFRLTLLSLVCMQFTVLALSFLLPNYSQLVMDTGATAAGSILLPGCLVGAMLAPVSGRVYDRLGAARPILCGCACQLVACALLLATADAQATLTATLLYLVFAFGQGLLAGNLMTSALSALPVRTKPDGNASVNTLVQLAGALGTSVVTTIVNACQAAALAAGAAAGSEAYALATMRGTRASFAVLVALTLADLALQLRVLLGGRAKADARA